MDENVKKSKSIIPSAMDEGYEIHIGEYAKLHTECAFKHNNNEIFQRTSEFAESFNMLELDEAYGILADLLDARITTSRRDKVGD